MSETGENANPTPPQTPQGDAAVVAELLQRGIAAARAGDRSAARALLEQAVAKDPRHEKAWFWLAAVVDDANAKRVCLANVVAINPNNERAQRLLKELSAPPQPAEAPIEPAVVRPSAPISPPAPAAPPRLLDRRWIVMGAVTLLIVLVALVFLLSGGGDDEETDPAAAVGSQPTATPTFLPTATPIPRPPTWTPVPTLTPLPDVQPTLFPAPALPLQGQIVAQSGYVPGDNDNQPIVVFTSDGTARQLTAGSARGHAAAISPDGAEVAFVEYLPGTRENVLQIITIQSGAARPASAYWQANPPIFYPNMPAWSPDGLWLAFVGQGPSSSSLDLYRVSLADPAGSPLALERLTSDTAVERWPAFSPDGWRIVYAAEFGSTGAPTTELRVYDLRTGESTNLTANGSALTESAPDWSPDGQKIAFAASAEGAVQTDIYTMAATGAEPPLRLVDWESDEIQPRFSPDGRYLIFSSNRTGNWDIFIVEMASRTFYQMTNSRDIDVANDWGSTTYIGPLATPTTGAEG